MEYKVGVISGDGIGPEIVTEAKKVLDKIADKYGHSFNYTDILMGGCSIDATGVPLTDEAIATALDSDAVLMGSIGGNTATSPWYKLAPELRPEAGLLKLRKSLNLFANLRPAYLYKELAAACPLRSDIIGDGFDMMIMRELTGGLYFGARETKDTLNLWTVCQWSFLRLCGKTQTPKGTHRTEDMKMKNINEMRKAEMEQEIRFAEIFVNKGGRLNQDEWNRIFKLMALVKEG